MRKGIEIAFKSVEYRSSLRSNKKKNLSRQSNNLIGLGIAKVRTFLMQRMTTSLTIKRDLVACRTRQAAPGHSLAHSDSGNSLVSNRPLSTLIPAPKFYVNYCFYIQSQTRLNDYMDSQKTRIRGLYQTIEITYCFFSFFYTSFSEHLSKNQSKWTFEKFS